NDIIKNLRKENFDLKMGLLTGQVTDFSQMRKKRVKIAQALTLLNMKKNSHV
ncbi:50S ribosomal protein L29, partial [Candidatus Babeliales bacterium]|nr:50S ribosomal protein L29 [Candidatus Babeliales bacterium]